MAARQPLLVVDGYNVIYGTDRYRTRIDEHAGAGALADVASLSRDPYGHDPHHFAREALVADVAAYAQGSYEPVVVFDAARNLSEDRPERSQAGVRVVFSARGESADQVIERLAAKARAKGREVLLVTSDNAIRSTVGGVPVTCISSQLLAGDIETVEREATVAREERTHARLTLRDRLDPKTRAKIDELLGRG